MTQADDGVARATGPSNQPTSSGNVGVAEPDHGGVRGLFSEYIDGSLNPDDRQRVDDHRSRCDNCSTDLATLQATVDVVGQLPTVAAPARAKAAIVQRTRLAG